MTLKASRLLFIELCKPLPSGVNVTCKASFPCVSKPVHNINDPTAPNTLFLAIIVLNLVIVFFHVATTVCLSVLLFVSSLLLLLFFLIKIVNVNVTIIIIITIIITMVIAIGYSHHPC